MAGSPRRRLIALLVVSLLPILGLGALHAPGAQAAATVTVSTSGAATQYGSSSVTVTGSTDVDRFLYVYDRASGACPATAAENSFLSQLGYGAEFLAAGAFTKTLTWFPAEPGARRLCAYLTSSTIAAPDATGAADVTVAAWTLPAPPTVTLPPLPPLPPVPDYTALLSGRAATPAATGLELLAPADGGAAEKLNPTFRWRTAGDAELVETLRIQRDEPDGSATKLVDATISEFTAWEDADGGNDGKGATGDTSEIATTSVADGTVTLQFHEPLPPGHYSWFVTRTPTFSVDGTDSVRSERRGFTVLGPHLGSLTARSSSRRGRTSKYPGTTTVQAKATAYARVKMAVRHQGRQNVFYFHTDGSGAASLPVGWSCARPGGTYRVAITASDQYGATRTRTIGFGTVARSRCAQMKRKEARARRARERRQAAAQRAADRAAAHAHATEIRRYKRNCNAIGGTPRTIDTGSEFRYVCVAPLGGLLAVPGF